MNKRAEFIVSGIVQGVGFRYFVYHHAKEQNLKGYTRNLWDGTVEVIAEGSEEQIDILHELLKAGPRHARVDRCQITYSEYTDQYESFEVF
jgi:acylphosphatase